MTKRREFITLLGGATTSLDQLIGAQQERFGDFQSERVGGC